MQFDRKPGALEREQELMKLSAHAALGGPIRKLGDGRFESGDGPSDRYPRMLGHALIIGGRRVRRRRGPRLRPPARNFTREKDRRPTPGFRGAARRASVEAKTASSSRRLRMREPD